MNISSDRKSIIITGAASGIGLATARLFAQQGWFVGAYDIDAASLEKLQAELGDENCTAEVLDVSDRQRYSDIIDKFAQITDGRLDLLFSNAGFGAPGPFIEQAYEDQIRLINVNLVGMLNGIHLAVKLLRNTPNSLCFNTASAGSIFGLPNLAVYSATKHAIRGLTESLSVEFDAIGVRVASVLPGVTDTALIGDEQRAGAATEGMFRLIQAEDVAAVVWEAYGNPERLHWFVPEELTELDKASAMSPEGTRAQIMASNVT